MNKLLKDLDNIEASQELKQRTLNTILSHKKKTNQKPLVLGLVIVALLIFMFIPTSKESSVAYISMDINPSFEFEVNEDYKIINIISYNNDGDKIINESHLKGQKLNDALNSLLTNQEYNQYLKTGILEVSVFSLNQKLSNELQSFMDTVLEQGQVKQYHCSQIDQKTYETANQHHMSGGKYQVIEKILSYNSQYTQEELKNKSMKDLYSILEDLNPNEVPKSCQNHGNHKNRHK
ncbi:MAG: hypothetical protein RR558_09855 [Coprobacillus sp.]